MYTRILVYDGSDGARAALREASELAQAFGASISLVHATGKLGDEPGAKAESGAEARGRHILDEAIAELEARAGVERGGQRLALRRSNRAAAPQVVNRR